MPFKWRKKQAVRVLHVAKPEWSKDDAAMIKQLVKSPTFPRLVAVLNGYLICNIIAGNTSEEGRRAYLTAIEDIRNIGNIEDQVEDSEEMVSMSGLGEI